MRWAMSVLQVAGAMPSVALASQRSPGAEGGRLVFQAGGRQRLKLALQQISQVLVTSAYRRRVASARAANVTVL